MDDEDLDNMAGEDVDEPNEESPDSYETDTGHWTTFLMLQYSLFYPRISLASLAFSLPCSMKKTTITYSLLTM